MSSRDLWSKPPRGLPSQRQVVGSSLLGSIFVAIERIASSRHTWKSCAIEAGYLQEVVVMVYADRWKCVQKQLQPKCPLVPLDLSGLHEDYDSYTMLLRVMLRLTDANNARSEILSYEAFKPCISALVSTFSSTIPFLHAHVDALAGEISKPVPVETVIDIDASPFSSCPSELDMAMPKSCVRAYSASNQVAFFRNLNIMHSLGVIGRNKRERGWMSRSDAAFLIGVVVCFFFAAKLIARTSTLPVANYMKWYNAAPGMRVWFWSTINLLTPAFSVSFYKGLHNIYVAHN